MASERAGAAIFDLDGTLADSLTDIAAAMNRVLAARELPRHPLPAYRRFVGRGVRVLVECAVPDEARAALDEIEAAFAADYGEHLLVRTAPYPGVVAALGLLAERGLPLAVLSNKLEPLTKKIVGALFSGVPFRCVRGKRAGVPRKPDPVAALAIALELGVAPDRCVLVGDTAIDVRTALAAGMGAVGVLWGFRDRTELERAGARQIIGQAAELPAVLGVIPAVGESASD